ncbi:MAG TPA: rhodanese-related sulfurtransferase [Candidatus Dormibacteraeota bacterium]|nr:rhodanese-related sulfurtransferase [Candidatus Dormibacteraeota bacterium]
MQKVILFYKFIEIEDPSRLMDQQKRLCSSLGLRGRILISNHGVNGTLGGTKEEIEQYIKSNDSNPILKNIWYKWSDGKQDTFPKLSIKVRDEIITFGAKDEIKVDTNGIIGTAKHINADELHDLIAEKGDQVIFFDGRNSYESAIGRFKGAVLPNVNKTKEFLEEIKDPKYDYLKDKIIITYCTGGIRCEVLGTLLLNRGFKHVYQLEGGIVSYCEKYGDEGLWEGSLYVFDRRMTINYSDNTKNLGVCTFCQNQTNRYINCANKICNLLFLSCEDCIDKKYCLNELMPV